MNSSYYSGTISKPAPAVAVVIAAGLAVLALPAPDLVGVLLLALLGGAAILGTLVQWRVGIIVIFWLIIFEDFIRKMVPGQPLFVIAVKDVLTLLTIIALALQSRRRLVHRSMLPVILPLLSLFVIEGIQTLNQRLPSWILAIAGLKLDFLPVLLFFAGAAYSRDLRKELSAPRWLIPIALVLSVFALFQLTIDPYTAKGVLAPTSGAGAGNFHSYGELEVRYTFATFASSQKLAAWLVASGILVLAWGLWRKRHLHILILISLPVPFLIGLIASGKRTPILLFLPAMVIYTAALLSGTSRKRQSLIVAVSLAELLGAAVLLDMSLGTVRGSFVVDALKTDFATRFFGSTTDEQFFVSELNRVATEHPVTGYGTGSNGQGKALVTGFAFSRSVEHGPLKVWYELGVFGLAAWMSVWIGLLFVTIRAARRLQGTGLAPSVVMILYYQVCILIWFIKGHQIGGDAQAMSIFWFVAGYVCVLPRAVARDWERLNARSD